MNDRERERLRLITTLETGMAQRVIDERLNAIFADHAAKGRLHSGATIEVSVSAMNESASAFLIDLGNKVKAVASDSDAFAALSTTVGDYLDDCAERMPPITRMASGRLTGPRDERIERVAGEMFDQMRADVEAKLAIAAFDFEGHTASPAALRPPAKAATTAKKGGRPPAEFWDDMWAAIAASLYSGDLKPKSQADVQRAMAEWIEANDRNAADSTVKSRARRLWDRIAALDE